MAKIVHLVMSDSFAGIEQHVDELLTYSKNNEVLICTESIAKYFNEVINVVPIKDFGRNSIIGKYKLKKKLKRINPDVVHTHGSKTTSIINSIKNNFKHIATVHGIKKNKKVYEKCDLVIGVSNKAIEDIKNKTLVISNWWNPKLKKSTKQNNKYALAVGRLEKVKGFDLLIESWTNIKTKLVIIGSGKEKQNLLYLVKKNNLANKIEILDEVKREELISYYENASVLIVSSRDEGGPRVALEALYLGIPVISTDVGHMPDILPKELLANKDDLASLQELLELYVDSIDLIDQSAIFEFVQNEFSIDERVKAITSAYEGVLSN